MTIETLEILLKTLITFNGYTDKNFLFFLIVFFIIFYLLNLFPFPIIILNICTGFFFEIYGIFFSILICITNNITHNLIVNLVIKKNNQNYNNKYLKIIKKNLNLRSFILFQAIFPIAIVNYFYSYFQFELKKQVIGTVIGVLPSVISGVLIGLSLNNNLENLFDDKLIIFTDKNFLIGIFLLLIVLSISLFKNIKLKIFKIFRIKEN